MFCRGLKGSLSHMRMPSLKKRSLLPENKVKYVEDIIFKRGKTSLGISRKEVIQVISKLDQSKLFVQEENHLD